MQSVCARTAVPDRSLRNALQVNVLTVGVGVWFVLVGATFVLWRVYRNEILNIYGKQTRGECVRRSIRAGCAIYNNALSPRFPQLGVLKR